jgi:putative membrane protein
MNHIVTRIIVLAFTIIVVAQVVPGIHVDHVGSALIAAFVLSILNALIRPLLLVLTFPITFLTFGLFVFVINASVFLAASALVPGFEVVGFLPALFGSTIVSVVSTLLNRRT